MITAIEPYAGLLHDNRSWRFGSTGSPTDDVAWTLAGLGAGAGRVSTVLDLGSCRPWLFSLEPLFLTWASAPATGEYLGLWAVGGDATVRDGGVGVTDSAISSINLLKNFKQTIGAISETALSATAISTSIPFEFHGRYLQLAIWNYSAADALSGTASENYAILKGLAMR